jgi:hypothetical protein
MMLNKMPDNTSMDSVLDHLEAAPKWGARNRAMFAIRQRLRIRDISGLLISDVLGLDGKIRSCYMSADGLVFRLDDQLRTELEKYLLKRFNVPSDSLRQLFQADLMRPLFPTQKRDRFSNNTLAQHFSYLDKSIKSRFELKKINKRSSWLKSIRHSLSD